MLRSIRTFLRNLFARRGTAQDEDPAEAFEPIDVERLGRELRLDELAERFGRANLPAADDPAPDHAHVQTHERIAGRVARAFRRANRKLHGIEDAVRARSIESSVEEALHVPEQAAQSLDEKDARHARAERALRAERDDALDRIQRYRTRYGLERGPELPETPDKQRRLRWALLLGLAQAGANAVLFAQGMHYGLIMGLSLAVVLGAFDILAHVQAGRIASRVQAPDLGNLTLGAVFTLLVTVSIPSYNLGLVHLRNGIRTLGFTDGFEQWWPMLRADPFGFSDFGSFALLTIGLTCSLMAVAAGWAWDEPIPALRRAGRRVREADEELAWHHERRRSLRRDVTAAARRTLAQLAKKIERDRRAADALAGLATILRENLFAFVRDAERAHDALVQRYRDENRLHRAEPVPAYFHERPSLHLKHPIALETTELEAELEEQRRLEREFFERLPALQEAIDALQSGAAREASADAAPRVDAAPHVSSGAAVETTAKADPTGDSRAPGPAVVGGGEGD